MQRDLTGEIIVAVVAVLIIVLGLVLGVLLSLPAGLTNQSIVSTEIVLFPSVTLTTGVTDTRTQQPVTLTHTATVTIFPDLTDETISTSTPRVTPGKTDTLTHTATATDIPSETPTSTYTHTFTPTFTETEKPTRTPSRTASRQATATSVVQMATVTPSTTQTIEVTAITATPLFTETLQATETETALPTATEKVCYRPSGWVDYVVKRGDTLFKIAQATDTTVSELQRVNCIDDIDRIIAGTRLFVPNTGIDGDTDNSPGGGSYGRIGCTNVEISRISNLYPLQRVRNSFSVIGTAFLDDFWYYKLEIQSDETGEIHFWSESKTAVQNGFLGEIMTQGFGSGIYWVRLVVVYPRGDTPPENICAIPVYFP